MDQERFDRITRAFATGQSRRGVLKGLTGTAIGGLLATVGLSDASARGACRAPSHKCGKGKNAQCCDSGQICTPGGCVTQTRFVFLTWNHDSTSSMHCDATVSVSGFAEGTYLGFISIVPGDVFEIVVGPDGTGSVPTGGSYTINPGTVVATVDGVSSALTTMTCPAV